MGGQCGTCKQANTPQELALRHVLSKQQDNMPHTQASTAAAYQQTVQTSHAVQEQGAVVAPQTAGHAHARMRRHAGR
jgi:hypothetical protein